MKRKQAGVSLIGVLIIGAILGFLFLMGMRTVPAVTEYFAVKKIINVIVDSGPGPDTTVSDLRKDFDKRAYIDQVEHVTGKDLAIYKRGNVVEISVAYSRIIPIFGNASLLLEFDTQAKRGG
ncbi:MAG: DUF4845 domain-containing protein [Rhodocyclaceae bacterium]|nr:DUF4845 domain-containing protein [Rhodocyclaceae bacterium]MCB1962363.1 DUF4845 domain-containing protein [Rhodocyclaceae bacterium]